MGCLKLTYQEENQENFFQGLWKKGDGSENCDNYYPFGLMAESSSREGLVKQNYKYNGKELQDEMDLGWLDYGARMYMADIGRWGAVDPLAEKYVTISPFAYVANDPINSFDPNGEEIYIIGDRRYIANVLSALLQIARSRAGAQLIQMLAASKDRVIITNGAKNGQKGGEDQNGNKTSYVEWNPSITQSEGKERPAFIGLAHEIRHSAQYFSGYKNEQIVDGRDPFADNNSINPQYNQIDSEEIDATHFENEIRAANGIEARRHYSYRGHTFDADISNDQKKFSTEYTSKISKYTIPNTRDYQGERNQKYAIFWARLVNSLKRGPRNLSEYSMKSTTRNSGINPGYDYREAKESAIIKF